MERTWTSRSEESVLRVVCCVNIKVWSLLTFVAVVCACSGQTLNLPPRHPKALTGTQFTNIITSLPAPSPTSNERENWIFHQIISGNVPDFLRTLKPISVSASGHTATYYVTPDYLAIGSDADYFLTPMTPLLAQRLCDYLGYTLPTRKMVNQIWTNAAVKMEPQPIAPSPEMITVPVFAWHNYMVRTQRNGFTNSFPLGALVGGNKKDVIISARIYTNFATSITEPVVIYGWHYPDGSPIQPLYNGHEETYADYSHGVRLVQMNLTVDGSPNTVSNVLKNPTLASLLSDDGASEGTSGGLIPVPRYTIAPYIIEHPRGQSAFAGTNVQLSVQAVGEPSNWRWRFSGADIGGATNSTFTITNFSAAKTGNYTVVVTNSEGSVTSRVAVVRLKSSSFPLLFADDFDLDTSANWSVFWGAANAVSDYTADWAFDYGSVSCMFNGVPGLIPSAPNSLNGSTRAVRFTVNNNDNLASTAGVNIYPNSLSLTGNFALKFDLWINYPGNAGGTGAGIAGSTQHGIFGINHFGTNANWSGGTAGDGVWFAASGEGGDSGDYRSYIGSFTGPQTNLTGSAAASGLIGSNNSAAVFQTIFPASLFESSGAPGKNWVEVELRQTNNMIVWLMDGAVIALRTNTSGFVKGNIMLGLMDTFASIANPVTDTFVLFDNVRVENLSPPIRFQSVNRVPDGSVSLIITSALGDNFVLESSTNLTSWQTVAGLTATNNPVNYIDSSAGGVPTRFYRARR